MVRLSLCVVIVYTVAAIGTDDTAKRRSEEILRAVAAAATADYEGLAQMKAQKVKTRDQISETTRTKNCLADLAKALDGEQVELEKSANNASNEAEFTYAAHIRGNRSALQAAIQKAIGDIYKETEARYNELKEHATQMMTALEDEVDKRTISVEEENDPVQLADELMAKVKTGADITPAKVASLLEDLLLTAAHVNAQELAGGDAKQADQDYVNLEALLRAAGEAEMTELIQNSDPAYEYFDGTSIAATKHYLGCYEGKLPDGQNLPANSYQTLEQCQTTCEAFSYFSRYEAGRCYCGNTKKDMKKTQGCDCDVPNESIFGSNYDGDTFGYKKVGDNKSCVYGYSTKTKSTEGSGGQKTKQQTLGDQERFRKGGMQDYLEKKLTRKEKEHFLKIISITKDHVNSTNHYEASGIETGAYTAASAKANDKYLTVNTAHTDLGKYLEALKELDADELKKIADIKEEFESLAADWLQLAIYHCCDIVQGNQLECDDATTHLAAPIESVFPGALKIPNVLTDCGRRLL